MRIRKNSKMSALFLSSDDTLLRCQLNQSPWDVITFPPSDSSPPPYQFDGNDSFAGNGSLVDSVGAVESSKSSSIKTVRTRKASTASFSNPNEFYYYSGFGPQWGKKRDKGHSLTNKRERETVEPVKVKVPLHHSLSTHEIGDDDDEGEKCVNGKKRRRKPIKVRSLKDLCEGMY